MTEADFQIVQNIYELGIMIIHLGILIGLFYIFVPSEALEKRKLYGLLTTIVLERIIVWIIPHDTKGIFFLVSLVTLIAFLFKEMREVQCLFLYIFFLWHSIFSICFMLTEIFTSALSDKLLARVDYSLSNPMEDVYRQLSIWIGFSTLIYALVVIVELVIIKATVKQKYFMTIREAAGLSVYTIVTLLLMYMFAEMAVVPVGSEVFIFTEQNRSLVLKQPVIAVLLYVGQLGGLIIWQEFQALKEREIEHQQILSQTEYAKRYIDDLESYYTKIRILKHDMAGKLTTLRGLLETDSKEAAIDYLSKMDVELSGSDNKYKTGNTLLDIIVNEKGSLALQKGIDYECDINISNQKIIPAYDVGVIISNLLDNAIEAINDGGNGKIQLKAFVRDNVLILEVKNNKQNLEINWVNGLPVSTKLGNHGLGLKSVKQIAEKYLGTLCIDTKDNWFTARVMLQLPDHL